MMLLTFILVELSSVGCGIDPTSGILYPMLKNGSHDWDNPCHVDDVDEGSDFWDDISDYDKKIIIDLGF